MINHSVFPTRQAERIESIDVIRGVSLLGILALNIWSFAMPPSIYIRPIASGDFTWANYITWYVTYLLFYQKMMNIFSMLFGAGVILMTARLDQSGAKTAKIYFRRILILFVMGLIHAYGLWFGDVLARYAMCAVVIFWLRNFSPRSQLIVGILLFALSSLLALRIGLPLLSLSPQEAEAYLATEWRIPPENFQYQLRAFRGGWFDHFFINAFIAFWIHGANFLFQGAIFRPMGLMLIGMALYKWGVFSAQRSLKFYRLCIAAALLIGLPIIVLELHLFKKSGFSGIFYESYGNQFNYWASPLVSLGWIGVVMILCKQDKMAVIRRSLAAVGQMALTNYLMQTVICILIFYGTGLGYFGYLDRWRQAMVLIGIWIFQMILSPLWLRYFRFGPMEWLWRSLTYGKRQAFLRS